MSFLKSRWAFPLACAASAVAFVAVADKVIRPLHVRGVWQPAAGWVNGAARLLEMPGLLVAERFGLRFRHHINADTWAVMLAAMGPVYFVAAVLLRWLWGAKRRPGPAGQRPTLRTTPVSYQRRRSGPPRAGAGGLSRRDLLTLGGRRALVGAAAAVGGYAFVAEPHWIDVSRRRFVLPGLHPSLDGFTVAQVTDLHHGPWTSVDAVRHVVDLTNALGADLIALTGDYVHQSAEYIAPAVAELARLRARTGVVAIRGNHDWWEDGALTARELARAGIPLIDNARVFVTPDRFLLPDLPTDAGVQALCVAGVGDLWEGNPDYAAALGGLPPAVPRLLLSHNPDVAEEPKFLDFVSAAPAAHRVDLMLSGHTHGGQIRLPGVGTPMIPSRYGQKYASGLIQGPACPVFVSRGIGMTIMPLRLGVRPEIAVIELRAG